MNKFMSVGSTSHHMEHVGSYIFARQPILDATQSLVAYELLFRSVDAIEPEQFDNHSASATVILYAIELGLDDIVGRALAYVNVDGSVLLEDFVSLLAPGRVVLEILETVVPTPRLMRRIAELRRKGFNFALDDVIQATEQIEQLLPIAEIIKVDIRSLSRELLSELVAQLKLGKKKLLAEKVETYEEFQLCQELGFDYFQGFYFAKPKILSGIRLSTSQLTITRLITLLLQEAPSSKIIECIKQDASISLTMLRMANSAMFGRNRYMVGSLNHALMLLGRRELLRWMQVLLYSEGIRKGKIPPLLVLAANRGKLLELLAVQLQEKRAVNEDVAFTVGIMSLLDTLLGVPMEQILDEIGVTNIVRQALLKRKGVYGQLLDLAIATEQQNDADDYVELRSMLQRVGVSIEQLTIMQYSAYRWSNGLLKMA